MGPHGPRADDLERMEHRQRVRVTNHQGLHARPCHSIVSTALEFKSELRIRSGDREVNGKSILELMTLSASVGSELELRAWGQDAEQLVRSVERLFVDGFGESAS